MLSYLQIDCSSQVKVADVSNSTSGVDARLSNRRYFLSAVQLNRVGTATGIRNRRRFPRSDFFQKKLSRVKWSEQIAVRGLTCKYNNSLCDKSAIHPHLLTSTHIQ